MTAIADGADEILLRSSGLVEGVSVANALIPLGVCFGRTVSAIEMRPLCAQKNMQSLCGCYDIRDRR
jgi:hypothetical protein